MKIMSTSYSTALSHIVLAGTSIYCYLGAKSIIYARCSYASILINSLLGVWRWGNPSYGPDANKVYKITTLLQDSIVLPFIVSTLWIQYDIFQYTYEVALANMIIPLIPVVSYLSNSNSTNLELLDGILFLNCGVLLWLSFTEENYFGLAAGVSYLVNYFWIKKDDRRHFDIPTQDLFNYAMCFFAYFSLRAVLD
ncbi:uncharacterized protein [Diabrotica undecimpunctata]|uniref:uncharacterized protein n=1 Tax=Diabrotica undecimpunctata TaxID=50387 RepID=UPI003B63DEC6